MGDVIFFPWVRMHRRPPASHLPSAIDVAMDHILWLKTARPGLSPEDAAYLVGGMAHSWGDVVQIYAEAWEALPLRIRRDGQG